MKELRDRIDMITKMVDDDKYPTQTGTFKRPYQWVKDSWKAELVEAEKTEKKMIEARDQERDERALAANKKAKAKEMADAALLRRPYSRSWMYSIWPTPEVMWAM